MFFLFEDTTFREGGSYFGRPKKFLVRPQKILETNFFLENFFTKKLFFGTRKTFLGGQKNFFSGYKKLFGETEVLFGI